MLPTKVLIIEDEGPARTRLRQMLAAVAGWIEVAWEADSVESAANVLREHQPDIIFTDVQLGDGTCFDLFREARTTCPVIFITAYDEHALKAFQHFALDYLLKPLKKEDLERALEKWRAMGPGKELIDYSALARAVMEEEEKRDVRYLIRFGEHLRTISSSEIAYVYTTSKAVFFVLHSGREYPSDKSLEQLEKELDPKKFFRINRQFIVSRASIGPMSAATKSRVRLELRPPFLNGEVIVSTEKSPLFKTWLGRR